MKNYSKGFFYGVMIAAVIVVVVSLVAALFMQLWNWLIPDLFNGPVLTYWQALGLLILSKLLFGGMGHHKKHKHYSWKNHWKHHCDTVSDEDRSRWKSNFMGKWNCTHVHVEEKESCDPEQEKPQ